jgi:hypothetical protein
MPCLKVYKYLFYKLFFCGSLFSKLLLPATVLLVSGCAFLGEQKLNFVPVNHHILHQQWQITSPEGMRSYEAVVDWGPDKQHVFLLDEFGQRSATWDISKEEWISIRLGFKRESLPDQMWMKHSTLIYFPESGYSSGPVTFIGDQNKRQAFVSGILCAEFEMSNGNPWDGAIKVRVPAQELNGTVNSILISTDG